MNNQSLKFFIVCICLAVSAVGCEKMDIANLDSFGDEIICFGDSITEGFGANLTESYPAVLAELLGEEVINAGVSGDTTRNALARIENDVLSKSPKLVIVEFGANDYFHKIPREETFQNIDKIIRMIQDDDAMVALAVVKLSLIKDKYEDRLREIAKERKALYIPNIMKGIIHKPDLKSDSIHPNAAGYILIAERIHEFILPLLEKHRSVVKDYK